MACSYFDEFAEDEEDAYQSIYICKIPRLNNKEILDIFKERIFE